MQRGTVIRSRTSTPTSLELGELAKRRGFFSFRPLGALQFAGKRKRVSSKVAPMCGEAVEASRNTVDLFADEELDEELAPERFEERSPLSMTVSLTGLDQSTSELSAWMEA